MCFLSTIKYSQDEDLTCVVSFKRGIQRMCVMVTWDVFGKSFHISVVDLYPDKLLFKQTF